MNSEKERVDNETGAPAYSADSRVEPEQPENRRSDRVRAYDRKSPTAAGILSLMPGLGQVYLGYYQHGFLNIAVAAITIFILESGSGGLEPLLGFFLSFFWLYNIVDAVRRARLYNAMLQGTDSLEPPSGLGLPGVHGSLVGGAALILVGFILFLHTKFDVSMAWLQDWWPLLAIGLGIYLFSRGMRKKMEDDAEL